MNTVVEYIPDLPPTDLMLLPAQNRAMLGERFTDWDRYLLPFDFHKYWRWN